MSPDSESLFQTVPKKNLLGLMTAPGKVDINKTRKFLEFTKEDVASATNVSPGSVRFDARMPSAVRDRMIEIATICELVAEHFGDVGKAALWFKLNNPLLGSLSPRDMLRLGRFKKLHRFVVEAMSGL